MKRVILCLAVVATVSVLVLAYLAAVAQQPCEFGPCQISR